MKINTGEKFFIFVKIKTFAKLTLPFVHFFILYLGKSAVLSFLMTTFSYYPRAYSRISKYSEIMGRAFTHYTLLRS